MPTVIHASQGIRNGPLAAFRNTTNGIVREKRPSRGVMRISKISGRSVQAVQVNRSNEAINRRDASENNPRSKHSNSYSVQYSTRSVSLQTPRLNQNTSTSKKEMTQQKSSLARSSSELREWDPNQTTNSKFSSARRSKTKVRRIQNGTSNSQRRKRIRKFCKLSPCCCGTVAALILAALIAAAVITVAALPHRTTTSTTSTTDTTTTSTSTTSTTMTDTTTTTATTSTTSTSTTDTTTTSVTTTTVTTSTTTTESTTTSSTSATTTTTTQTTTTVTVPLPCPATAAFTGLSTLKSLGNGVLGWSCFCFNWTASAGSHTINFKFRQDMDDWFMDIVSLLDSSANQLIINGGFESPSGLTANSRPRANNWTWSGASCACCVGIVTTQFKDGVRSWSDGCNGAIDNLSQTILDNYWKHVFH